MDIRPALATPIASQATLLASRGRRFGAFLVDITILWGFGWILGKVFFKLLCALELRGLVVGFCIALIYFAIPESDLGGGWTIGKRICGLKLVNARGSLISVKRSVARYALFASPYFVSLLRLPPAKTSGIILFLVIFISLGIGGATIYLLLFNSRTEQGFHDVVFGTYVVRAPGRDRLNVASIWRWHWVIVSLSLCATAIIGLSVAGTAYIRKASGHPTQQELDESQIEHLSGVRMVEVRVWNPSLLRHGTLRSVAPKHKRATIVINYLGTSSEREAVAKRAVNTLLQTDPRLKEEEEILVKVGRNYNLGFVSGNDYMVLSRSPGDWKQWISHVESNK